MLKISPSIPQDFPDASQLILQNNPAVFMRIPHEFFTHSFTKTSSQLHRTPENEALVATPAGRPPTATRPHLINRYFVQ